jgi:hypothetical protein
MAGETLATYNAVTQHLEGHRGEWLKLMEVWEQAQSLLDTESVLGSRRARLARRKVREANASVAMSKLLSDCEKPLDQIEQAHEQVAERVKSCTQANDQLAERQTALQAAKLSTEPYETGLTASKSLIAQARTLVSADPLGALRCLDDALGQVTQLNRKAVRILELVKTAGEVAGRIEDVTKLATERRGQGFLLREAEANPDPLLMTASQERAAAWEQMNRADEVKAAAALDKALALTQQADQAIQQHVAARARCESEIPTRRRDALRLNQMQSVVRGQQLELERDFAANSWFPVAENLSKAQAFLAAAQQSAETAERQAAADVQHYFQASRLLTQAAENQKLAETALTGIGQKLRELVELRIQCQTQIGQLRVQAESVARLLQANTADRVRANERFKSASAALDGLVQNSRLPRPDWSQLTATVREIQSDFSRAEQLAREDIQLAQQAAAEVTETEGVIREARTFHELGFTPELGTAETQLTRARAHLSAQEYEEAIRTANAAEQAAREARNLAMAQAQRRQQEIDAQRRAEEAARAASQTPRPHLDSEPIEPLLERQRIA